MPDKRSLPLLQEPSGEDPLPSRAPWQWVALGTVAIFVVWLPLAAACQALAARIVSHWLGTFASPEEAALALARVDSDIRLRATVVLVGFPLVGLVVASFGGGALVGRWGGSAGVREAALSGASAALIAALLTLLSGALSWAPLLAIPPAALAAAVGGALGRALRRRA